MNSESALLVMTTCPDRKTGERIAASLLEQRLAACVTLIDGALSLYHWQGQVQRDSEVQLQIKSSRQLLPRLQSAIESIHPYELPEVLAVPVAGGSAAYLDWLEASLNPTQDP